MKYRNTLIAAVVCTMAFALSAQAAPIIQLSMRLTDTNGVDLPNNNLNPGDVFNVVVTAQVVGPNFTDTARNNATQNNKPLGIENLNMNLLTPTTVNVLRPVDDGGGAWNGFADNTGFGYPQANVFDADSDTDVDVNGAGFVNTSLSMALNASATAVAAFQIGVNSLDIFAGQYIAGPNSGIALLTTQVVAANVYFDGVNTSGDPAAQRTALQAPSSDVSTGVINASVSVTIGSVPEPTTIGLAGLGLFGLLSSRRRIA